MKTRRPTKELPEDKQRTIQQNRALHLFFQLVADAMNEAGLDMRAVLKPGIDIPWSKDTVKEYLWRPIQDLQLRKESTADLTTKEIDVVFDTFNRHIAKFGLHQPFPSIKELMDRARSNEAH